MHLNTKIGITNFILILGNRNENKIFISISHFLMSNMAKKKLHKHLRILERVIIEQEWMSYTS